MFDARQFLIDTFRTPTELSAFVRAYGYEPPKEATVDKWFRRQSVPSEWFPLLLGLLELDRGKPVSLVSYLGVTRTS